MNVLIAVDLGDSTAVVIDDVQKVFAETSVKCWLLHVVDPDPAFVGYGVGPQPVRDAVAKRYREQHESVQSLSEGMRSVGFDCSGLLIQGPLAETILAQAVELAADIIVMGSHGKGMASQLIVGSTSQSVLKSSRLPVLVIPVHRDA